MKTLITLTLLVGIVFASQYVPISKRYPGISLSNDVKQVQVEFAYDPACQTTSEFDVKVKQVVDLLKGESVSFRFAIGCLPYHLTCFKQAQALFYVNEKKGGSEAMTLLRYFLENQDTYNEKSMTGFTIKGFMNKISITVASMFALNQQDLSKQLMHFSDTDNNTRKWVKYVMGILKAPGTPMMYLNRVRVDGATSMTVAELVSLIKANL